MPANCGEAYKKHDAWGKFVNIKEMDMPSSVFIPTGCAATISVKEGAITLSNIPVNSVVCVYTTDGELIETQRANKNTLTLKLPRQKIYIIKTSGKVFKVKV